MFYIVIWEDYMNIKAAILSVIMAGSSLAYATTTIGATAGRIAVVDVHAVLESMPQMKTMRTELEKHFATEHDAIASAQKTLKTKGEKIASNKSVMTPATYTSAKTALQKEQQTLQTKQTNFQQRVFAAQDSAMKKVMHRIKEVVGKIAARDHFDVVLPKNSTVYAAKGYDITTQVQQAITSTPITLKIHK